MPQPATVEEYIGRFDSPIADRLRIIRTEILDAVHSVSGQRPDEKIRYGMPAVMLGGRYALHYAAWKKHIGLYPVPVFEGPLEAAVSPHRAEKDSVVFPHSAEIPYDLVGAIATAVARRRSAAEG